MTSIYKKVGKVMSSKNDHIIDGLKSLDEYIEENQDSKDLIWKTLKHYFNNAYKLTSSLEEYLSSIFNDDIGLALYYIISFREIADSIISKHSFKNSKFFTTLINTFSDNAFISMLYEINPINLATVNINNTNEMILVNFLRADGKSFEVTIEPPILMSTINSLLRSYKNYINDNQDLKKLMLRFLKENMDESIKLVKQIEELLQEQELGNNE